MNRISRIMIEATIRRVDMQIKASANDNAAMEILQQKRTDLIKRKIDIIFKPCIKKAIKDARSAG